MLVEVESCCGFRTTSASMLELGHERMSSQHRWLGEQTLFVRMLQATIQSSHRLWGASLEGVPSVDAVILPGELSNHSYRDIESKWALFCDAVAEAAVRLMVLVGPVTLVTAGGQHM